MATNKINLSLKDSMAMKINLSIKPSTTFGDIFLNTGGFAELMSLMMSLMEQADNDYPFMNQMKNRAIFAAKDQNRKSWFPESEPSRRCVRCHKLFEVDTSGNIPNLQCMYKDNRKTCFSKTHVLSLMREATLHEFVATPTRNGSNDYRSKKAYALDTEHVFTDNGLEVARVTLVDLKKQVVMDSYVLPKHKILDYNTKYSGIVEADLAKAITLEQCHQELFQYVNAETILIGHSLEADLKALRLCHHNVVDTAVVFAKKVVSEGKACIKKVALRKLAEGLLGRKIQSGSNGHCSVEDASTCIDLLAQKLNEAVPVHTSLTESLDQSSLLDTSGMSSTPAPALEPATASPRHPPPPRRLPTPMPLMSVKCNPFQGAHYYRCPAPAPPQHRRHVPVWNLLPRRNLMIPQVV